MFSAYNYYFTNADQLLVKHKKNAAFDVMRFFKTFRKTCINENYIFIQSSDIFLQNISDIMYLPVVSITVLACILPCP